MAHGPLATDVWTAQTFLASFGLRFIKTSSVSTPGLVGFYSTAPFLSRGVRPSSSGPSPQEVTELLELFFGGGGGESNCYLCRLLAVCRLGTWVVYIGRLSAASYQSTTSRPIDIQPNRAPPIGPEEAARANGITKGIGSTTIC
jgi:hypothetical protein